MKTKTKFFPQILLAILLVFSGLAHAGTYRCGNTYQQTPCNANGAYIVNTDNGSKVSVKEVIEKEKRKSEQEIAREEQEMERRAKLEQEEKEKRAKLQLEEYDKLHTKQIEPDYSSEERDNLFETAKIYIKMILKDPDSAQFKNLSILKEKVERTGKESTKVIGEVNARNSFGGYTGFKVFSVVVIGEKSLPLIAD